MTDSNTQNRTKVHWKKIVTVALAACLLLTLAITVYASEFTARIFGWGNNAEVRIEDDGTAVTILYTEDLTEPVRIENGRMIFLVNEESKDITELVSQENPFSYSFFDTDGNEHLWLIGLNGPSLEQYGYAEFIRNAEGEWIGGYDARTNHTPDGKESEERTFWLSKGKEIFQIPW